MAEVKDKQQEYKIDGKELRAKTEELIRELLKTNKACRLVIKNAEGIEMLSIPVAAGVLFMFFAPILVVVATLGALLTECSIAVVYPKKEDEEAQA